MQCEKRRSGLLRSDHGRGGSPAMNRAHVASDLLVSSYAEGQPWTRDPRGSRVQDYSPRIPHGKVTKWQSISISPCQGVIIG